MPLAEFSLGDAFLAVLWFCGLFLWIALAIMVFGGIFGDHELGGWSKAAWTLGIIILPLLGILIYMIARGKSMQERQRKRVEENEKAFEKYVREAAGSPADDIQKLHDLKDRGAIDDEEFRKLKAKLVD